MLDFVKACIGLLDYIVSLRCAALPYVGTFYHTVSKKSHALSPLILSENSKVFENCHAHDGR